MSPSAFLLLTLSQFYMPSLYPSRIEIGIIVPPVVARSSQVASAVVTLHVRYGIAVHPHEFRRAVHTHGTHLATHPKRNADQCLTSHGLLAGYKEGLIQLHESNVQVRSACPICLSVVMAPIVFPSKVPKRFWNSSLSLTGISRES
jgi:hypothetical protein